MYCLRKTVWSQNILHLVKTDCLNNKIIRFVSNSSAPEQYLFLKAFCHFSRNLNISSRESSQSLREHLAKCNVYILMDTLKIPEILLIHRKVKIFILLGRNLTFLHLLWGYRELTDFQSNCSYLGFSDEKLYETV